MRTGWQCVTLALAIGAIAGCGKDSSTGPQPEQITGSWTATQVEYVSRPAGTAVDLIADGGSASLTLATDNTFHYVVTPYAQIVQITDGTWALGGDILSLTPQGMPFSWQFDVSLSGDTLGLTGASVEYDFNADGTPDDATLNLRFVRQAARRAAATAGAPAR